MAHPMIGEVTRYWDGLRHGRIVPAREEIDPREIQTALPYSFILDRPRPGTVRFRLSGMHLNQVLGMEARGMPVRAVCEVPYRKRLMEQVEMVFDEPALLEIELRADRGLFGPLRAHMALLPLRSGSGAVDRALGIFVTDGEIPNTPLRFMTRGFARTPLQAGVAVADSRRNLHPAGLAEEQAVYQPRPAPVWTGKPPELRVLEGGKT
ncbi:PAS domain-containing protein [Rhodobacterales bacterium HKCCE3408]|nr:PAS domain-containing protein [Rhodobacterales bacterium HKCCE3408]